MRKCVFTISILIVSICGYSQGINTVIDFEMHGSHGITQALKNLGAITTYDDIKGSPYLNSEFVLGDIFMNEGSNFNDIPLRYNIYSDNIEFMNSKEQTMEISDPKTYNYFEIADTIFKYLEYANGAKTQNGYLQLLSSGNVILYKKYNIGLKKAQEPEPYKEARPPEFFDKSPDFYISINGETPLFSKNSKQAEAILSTVKADVKSYIKKEKLKLNREEDLIKIVEYCNK